MNDDVVIRFENVSKKYKIRYGGLRHAVQNAASRLNPFRRFGDNRKPRKTEEQLSNSQALNESIVEDGKVLWALQDVSFEVKRGEVLGIIGPNGAGKSTILKLISGITSPTSGNVEVKGKVGALIEVGAGFHPELTGRENIYLNGSILGLKKKDIDERFDSIVDFSELGHFLDTPVKKYSSGMYVRLGFAVAVHMQPEVLLVDEVLAVGDASFRAKCYKRIRDLREKGLPIVLVSHDLTNIENLSDQAIFLSEGQIQYAGDVSAAIMAYHEKITLREADGTGYYQERNGPVKQEHGRSDAWVTDVTLLDGNNRQKDYFETGEGITIRIDYNTRYRIKNPVFGVAIHGGDSSPYIGSNTKLSNFVIRFIEGKGHINYTMPTLSLFPGTYFIDVVLCDEFVMKRYDEILKAYKLLVGPGGRGDGLFYPEHKWELHNE